MDVTPLVQVGLQIIQSYGSAGFKVSGVRYGGAILVTPEATHNWDVASLSAAALSSADFLDITTHMTPCDVILLGTGKGSAFLSPEVLQALRAQGIRPECMDTGAACRTYNVLMAEGRRVAVLLLPIIESAAD